MGFFKSISETIPIGNVPGGASGNDNYLPITKLDLIKLHSDEIAAGEYGTLGDSIEKEAAKLSRIICRHNAEMQALMTYLIREILRNIPEHAEESTAWICGQYWGNQTAEIAIVDEGIGIKKVCSEIPSIWYMPRTMNQPCCMLSKRVFHRRLIHVEEIVQMMNGQIQATDYTWSVKYARS